MIRFADENLLRWFYTVAQTRFERSSAQAVIERVATFSEGAIKLASAERVSKGMEPLEYGKPAMEDVLDRNGVKYGTRSGLSVTIRGEVRTEPGYTPDDEELCKYGLCSRRTLKATARCSRRSSGCLASRTRSGC